MVDVLILFPTSADTSGVDDFIARFVPVIKQAPGLSSVRISTGDLMSRGARPPFTRVMEFSFESLADWMAWVMSPERSDNVGDFDRFQPLVLFFEVTEA